MIFYGFVFANSKDEITSVSMRKVGEYSLATYTILDGPQPKDLDMSRILFVAKSKKRYEVEEAVEAVCNVYNSWCLNKTIRVPSGLRFQQRSDWTTTAKSCTIQEKGFVYIYRLWKNLGSLQDEAFYVGMSVVGNKSRESSHIDETIKAINKYKPLSNSKHIKIRNWLENRKLIRIEDKVFFHTYDSSQNNLVNRIAEGITQIAALAIENFLIFHYYGVFNLSNGTNGNSNLDQTGIFFLSRPRGISNINLIKWYEVVNDFLQLDGVLRQTARFDLQLLALLDGNKFVQELDVVSNGYLIADGPPSNNSADVEWSWKFAPNRGPQWLRLQLKFSAVHSAVAINLRKSNEVNWQEFRDKIKKIWRNPYLPNHGSGIYFKPYGISGSIRTVDVWFSYDDLNESSKVVKGYPALLSDNPDVDQLELDLTLPEAIARLIKIFLKFKI